MPIAPGQRLGPYEILSALGAGGMGEVWRARDTRLGREVALKVLPEALAGDPERIARFQREAQLLAALSHTNIAAIYSFESVESVQLLVMEMVPGETVREMLSAGPIGLSRALGIARQVADALDAAHGKGILHRDLKPANVKVTPEGKVKLLDFGLAKAFAPRSAAADISDSPTLDVSATREGVVLGTVSYMSPEQVRGRPLDWRSDIWSFGCLLFEMLSGKKAFGGESTSDILVAILDREPDWVALPSGTPARILDLLKGCLVKGRDERTRDLGGARQAIDAVLESRGTTVARSGLSVSTRIRRAPRAWAGAGALLAVAVAAVLYLAARGRETRALPAQKLLAILPATDLTGRPDGRQLCDGVSFSLSIKLQSVPGITVMRPSGPYMLKETDPVTWVRDTGANLLVQPAVRQMGAERQLSFSVFLAGSQSQLAAGEVTGPAADHFHLEDALARKLAAALRTRLASVGSAGTAGPPPVAPGAGQTDYVVALGYLERRDKADAVRNAVELLTRVPDGSNSALVQAALARSYLYLFELERDPEQAELAKQAASKAMSLNPNLPEAQVTLGQILTTTGEPKKAVEIIRKALESQPADVDAVLALGSAYQGANDDDRAEREFRRAIALRPTSWSAFNRLAAFYGRKGRDAEALEAFRNAARLNPDVAQVQQNIGAILLKQGRFEEAAVALTRSLGIRPTPQAYSNLGTTQYLLGRFGDAAASFAQAASLSPTNFHYVLYQGDALTWTPGRATEARAAYEKALRLGEAALDVNPNDPVEIALVARCRARLGQKDRAWREVTRAVALAPDDLDVLQLAAGVAAVLGRPVDALDLLLRASERGLGPAEVTRDPDLREVRALPGFERVVSNMSSKGKPS